MRFEHMKQLIVTVLIFFLGANINAQNLIPNGNFEEEVICIEYNLKCGPMGWRLASLDPPSYFSEFKKGDTVASAQYTSFVPFSLEYMGKYREYLQTSILCPLEKGRQYSFSMKYKAVEFAVKEIGVLFVANYIITSDNQIITANPQIKFRNAHFLFDAKNTWITLNTTYIANGTEKFLLIGNFLPQLLTDYKEIEFSGKEKRRSTYYIDDVVLKPADDNHTCDLTDYLTLIRSNRYRHTNPNSNFFPTMKPEKPIPFDSASITEVIKYKPIILKNIFFDVDKYELLPASFPELDKLMKLLSYNSELIIEIRGHTDNTGNEFHNGELSHNRAEAVANYLKTYGIAQKRITVKGFASSQPIESNETPAGRQENRRVEFVIQ